MNTKRAKSTISAKVNWFERTLLVGPHIALVTNQEELTKAVEESGCEPLEWDFETLGCACIHFKLSDGSDLCLIAVNPSIVEAHCDPIRAAGMLIHEVVHIYQIHRKGLAAAGLPDDDETEAYSIMNLSIIVLNEYSRLREIALSKVIPKKKNSSNKRRPPVGTLLRGPLLTEEFSPKMEGQ